MTWDKNAVVMPETSGSCYLKSEIPLPLTPNFGGNAKGETYVIQKWNAADAAKFLTVYNGTTKAPGGSTTLKGICGPLEVCTWVLGRNCVGIST